MQLETALSYGRLRWLNLPNLPAFVREDRSQRISACLARISVVVFLRGE